jgi:hypothetical protein
MSELEVQYVRSESRALAKAIDRLDRQSITEIQFWHEVNEIGDELRKFARQEIKLNAARKEVERVSA